MPGRAELSALPSPHVPASYLVVLFMNVAKFERSGQPLVARRNVDQHHPLTPSSTVDMSPMPRPTGGKNPTWAS